MSITKLRQPIEGEKALPTHFLLRFIKAHTSHSVRPSCTNQNRSIAMAVFTTSRISFIKLLELLLTATCVGLHYYSFEVNDIPGLMVVTGTFVGYLIILIGVYAGYLFSMPISKRIDIFYSVAGVALFIASGVLTIQHFENWRINTEKANIGLAKGSLAIINALCFLIDGFLSFRTE